jgi:predicted amino acid racemase
VVDIHLDGVLRNFWAVRDLAQAHGARLTTVTKMLGGYRPLIDALIGAGAASIGEARLPHLVALDKAASDKGVSVEKWLIRAPLPSQVADVVRYADVSLNSEAGTIRALGAAGAAQGRRHRVVVMVDIGDRREGVLPEDLVDLCGVVLATPGVELYGIGTALGCFGGIVPTPTNLAALVSLAETVEATLGVELSVVSGGSSSALPMLAAGTLPHRVNHLRVGEALLTGRAADLKTPVAGGYEDACTVTAEIIEIKAKPSRPVGERAPAETPVADDPDYPDNNVSWRALVAVGNQDVVVDRLVPADPTVRVLHGSSDLLVADITACRKRYHVGDVMTFILDYPGILRAMTSGSIDRRLV